MSAYYNAGLILGTAVGGTLLKFAMLFGGAWVFDKLLRGRLQDYYLAFVSFMPVALILLLGDFAGYASAAHSPDSLRAKVSLGGTILAVVVGLFIRIKEVDEEVGENG